MLHRQIGLIVVVLALLATSLRAQQPQSAEFNYGPDSPTLQYEPAASWWTTVAGAEATYLSLNSSSLERDTIRFGFEAAPRIWLGLQNANGWGGQVRYWQLDADSVR